MNPATYLGILALVTTGTQILRVLGAKLWPALGSGTAGRIIAALGSLAGTLATHGPVFDPSFFVQALITFLGSAGFYHTVVALPPGKASAGVSLLLPVLLAVGLSACVTAVPIPDSPLACDTAPAGVCQSGPGAVCAGTVTVGGVTRRVVVTYCEATPQAL